MYRDYQKTVCHLLRVCINGVLVKNIISIQNKTPDFTLEGLSSNWLFNYSIIFNASII